MKDKINIPLMIFILSTVISSRIIKLIILFTLILYVIFKNKSFIIPKYSYIWLFVDIMIFGIIMGIFTYGVELYNILKS